MRCQTDDRLGRTNDQSENSSIVKVIHRTENYLDKFCIWLNERYFQDKSKKTLVQLIMRIQTTRLLPAT